ncbi:hypothetical protein CO675_20200 [Bradyrhizobium sp. C9]|nr:hypothetical protein CO675_20200 [Bradyrhizobium sp. C9]
MQPVSVLPIISKFQEYEMRKSECVNLLARHLGVRATRLTSLTQRLAEAELLPTACGPPYPDLEPVEIVRMLLVGICDEGIGAAPKTVERYCGLHCGTIDLETALAHALSRPESVLAAHASLRISTGDHPQAILITVSPDGLREQVFGEPSFGSVERIVTVSGSALAAVSDEINQPAQAA